MLKLKLKSITIDNRFGVLSSTHRMDNFWALEKVRIVPNGSLLLLLFVIIILVCLLSLFSVYFVTVGFYRAACNADAV